MSIFHPLPTVNQAGATLHVVILKVGIAGHVIASFPDHVGAGSPLPRGLGTKLVEWRSECPPKELADLVPGTVMFKFLFALKFPGE